MKSMGKTAAVEGRHIVKNFRTGDAVTEVLKDLSLQVMQGEFVSIMGPSGSGKSTLLYILGGLDSPTSGRVLLNGTDISGFGDKEMSMLRRRSIGFVFQFYNLIPNLNAGRKHHAPAASGRPENGELKRPPGSDPGGGGPD